MGWWRSDNDAIIGDRPVDILLDAFHDLANQRARTGTPPPPEWLRDVVARALADGLRDFGDLADAPATLRATGYEPTDAEIAAVADALEQIVAEYHDSELNRGPTSAELHELVEFAIAELS
jgi:hypothetical protein